MTEKSTSYHTICRLLLRELRQERTVQQALISQLLGRASTSSWSKVEAGETPLTLEHLLTACTACQVGLVNFFQTVENYAQLLRQYGWYVAAYGSPLSTDEDLLSREANDYYSTMPRVVQQPGFARFPVLVTPFPYANAVAPLEVFRWAIDPEWKNSVQLGSSLSAN